MPKRNVLAQMRGVREQSRQRTARVRSNLRDELSGRPGDQLLRAPVGDAENPADVPNRQARFVKFLGCERQLGGRICRQSRRLLAEASCGIEVLDRHPFPRISAYWSKNFLAVTG